MKMGTILPELWTFILSEQSLGFFVPPSPQVFTLSLFPTTTLPHLSTGILGGHLSLAATESKLHL